MQPMRIDAAPSNSGAPKRADKKAPAKAIIDAVGADALEKCEGAVMRVEDHLLGLAWIAADEDHPAVGEADMSHLDGCRRAIEHEYPLYQLRPRTRCSRRALTPFFW
jgi:hypothetical protein